MPIDSESAARDALRTYPAGRSPLVDALEAIRTEVHRRLDRVEALARVRIEAHATVLADYDIQIEEQRGLASRSREEVERQRQSWDENLARLEEDRRMLADSWERLERERTGRQEPIAPPRSPAVAVAQPVAHSYPGGNLGENPLTQTMLQQYQAMRRDVRRALPDAH